LDDRDESGTGRRQSFVRSRGPGPDRRRHRRGRGLRIAPAVRAAGVDAQFNEWRRRVGADGWLVIAEQGRLLVAWLSAGQWRSVRVRPLNEASVALAQVLEQEQLLLSAGSANKVFLQSWAMSPWRPMD